MENTKYHVMSLLQKAAAAENPNDAMGFAQAASLAVDTLLSLKALDNHTPSHGQAIANQNHD